MPFCRSIAAAILLVVAFVARPTGAEAYERIVHKQAPETIRRLLGKNKSKDWFRVSVRLPSRAVDPVWSAIAAKLGGEVFLGGGSDLIELAVHHGPKLASPHETNIIDPRSPQQLKADLPADLQSMVNWSHAVFGTRPTEAARQTEKIHDRVVSKKIRCLDLSTELTKRGSRRRNRWIQINDESSRDLKHYVQNAEQGCFLAEGALNPASESSNASAVGVPFKHGYVARVTADGKAELFFRTASDERNYANKILTLPDEKNFPTDWPQKAGTTWVYRQLLYSLAVYARARSNGWRFSERTGQILRDWVAHLQQKRGVFAFNKQLSIELFEKVTDQMVPTKVVTEVIKEFLGIAPGMMLFRPRSSTTSTLNAIFSAGDR